MFLKVTFSMVSGLSVLPCVPMLTGCATSAHRVEFLTTMLLLSPTKSQRWL